MGLTHSTLFPVAKVDWHPAYRLVPTRFTSANLFVRVAPPADFDALYALESMTNDRLRDEVGKIELVPRAERLYGPGSGPIMAALTHLNPAGSRFSDGSYGVFYVAREKKTAVAETRHHQALFLRATNEAAIQLEMRVYHLEVSGRLHDLCALPAEHPIVAADSYAVSQAAGKQLRREGSNGVRYNSVRIAGGECVGIFSTVAVANCRVASQMLYQWDGARFSDIYEKVA